MKDKLMMTSGHWPLARTTDETLWLVDEQGDHEIRDDSTFLKVQKLNDDFYGIQRLYCGGASQWYANAKHRDDFVLL